MSTMFEATFGAPASRNGAAPREAKGIKYQGVPVSGHTLSPWQSRDGAKTRILVDGTLLTPRLFLALTDAHLSTAWRAAADQAFRACGILDAGVQTPTVAPAPAPAPAPVAAPFTRGDALAIPPARTVAPAVQFPAARVARKR